MSVVPFGEIVNHCFLQNVKTTAFWKIAPTIFPILNELELFETDDNVDKDYETQKLETNSKKKVKFILNRSLYILLIILCRVII